MLRWVCFLLSIFYRIFWVEYINSMSTELFGTIAGAIEVAIIIGIALVGIRVIFKL